MVTRPCASCPPSRFKARALKREGGQDAHGRVTMKNPISLIGVLLFAAIGSGPAQAQQVDVEAAQALAKRNDCFKCHAIDKSKKGPAYSRIAARLKTKPDGVETIAEHITSGHMVQLADGSDEEHKIIDTKDPAELRNLALWILSL